MKKFVKVFYLQGNGEQEFFMPVGAEILTVQVRIDGGPCICVSYTPSNAVEKRRFYVIPDNGEIDCDKAKEIKYIGSFQLVYYINCHVFELIGE